MQATLKGQTHEALFNENLVSSYFPNVKIFHITGTETPYYCMWGYMESSRFYKEAVARGDKVRTTKFKLVGGNHFVRIPTCPRVSAHLYGQLHYDMPEEFLREVVQGCKEL